MRTLIFHLLTVKATYKGPSSRRGTRWVVQDADGYRKMRVDRDYALSVDEDAARAMVEFVKTMGLKWGDHLLVARVDDDTWVGIPSPCPLCEDLKRGDRA